MKINTFLPDESATLALGSALVQVLQPGLILYLQGNLGAGKTTLVRALLHAAGHIGAVKSPTYTLVEPYRVQINQHTVDVMHFDLYRLASPIEFLEAGFREYFNPETICLVEWSEKAELILPAPDLVINLVLAESGRKVELRALSDRGVECLNRLKFVP